MTVRLTTRTFPPLDLRYVQHTPPGRGMLRYTEAAGTYNYTLWAQDKVESRYGICEIMPAWLQHIVNAAMVGGHVRHTKESLPHTYFWCEVNTERQVLRFVNKGQPDVS